MEYEVPVKMKEENLYELMWSDFQDTLLCEKIKNAKKKVFTAYYTSYKKE